MRANVFGNFSSEGLKERALKILQVVFYFSPAYAFGGPVKVAYQIVRKLVKRKHEIVVYTSDTNDFGLRLGIDAVEVVDGIKVCYFGNLALMPVKKSGLPRARLNISKILQNLCGYIACVVC